MGVTGGKPKCNALFVSTPVFQQSEMRLKDRLLPDRTLIKDVLDRSETEVLATKHNEHADKSRIKTLSDWGITPDAYRHLDRGRNQHAQKRAGVPSLGKN